MISIRAVWIRTRPSDQIRIQTFVKPGSTTLIISYSLMCPLCNVLILIVICTRDPFMCPTALHHDSSIAEPEPSLCYLRLQFREFLKCSTISVISRRETFDQYHYLNT